MQLYPHYKKATWLVILVSLLAVFGLAKLETNASYLAYFDPADPLLERFIEQRRHFDKAENLVVLLRASDQRSFDTNREFYRASVKALKALKMLEEVQQLKSYLPELRWRNNVFQRSAEHARVGLLSADAQLAMLVLDVKLAKPQDPQQILHFTQQVQGILESQFETLAVEVILSGTIGLNRAYIETVRHDLKLFLPALLLGMLLCLFCFFRSFKIALLLLSCGIIASLSALGAVSWLGMTLTSINIFTPIIIIGLSVVMNTHNVTAFYWQLGKGKSAEQALHKSFRINLMPLNLSGITTALGFLMLTTSPSPPVAVTGIACALGVFFSLLLSMSVFQILLLQAKRKPLSVKEARVPKWCLRNHSQKRSVKITVITFGLAAMSAIALTGLKIDDNVYRYFAKDYDFSRSIVLIDQHFSATMSLEYQLTFDLDSNQEEQASGLEELYQVLHDIPQIGEVMPPVSLINRENINAFLASPTSKSPLFTYIDRRGERLRLEVRLKQVSARQLLALEQQINVLLTERLVGVEHSRASGADILFANLSYRNAQSMFYSLLIALTLISTVIALLLKSRRMALLVFSCNFLPLLFGYALLAISGGYLTLGSTVVIGMIIGVIVDDTIHLLYKFKRLRTMYDARESMEILHSQYFAPVIISSVTLCTALAVGLVSDFKPIFEISLFSILVIALALLVDTLVLPALLQLPKLKRRIGCEGSR